MGLLGAQLENKVGPGVAPAAGKKRAALALLWLACLYLWVLPLVAPRGELLGGHYKLRDLFAGVPLGLVTLGATLVLLHPPARRRELALRLTTIGLAVLVSVASFEVVYVLAVRKIWPPNVWYHDLRIVRAYNQADPELGFVRSPAISRYGHPDEEIGRGVHYRTDENGFRNAPGKRQADIVFIGDSFTEAVEVAERDTFVERVGAASGRTVVNLGRSGYGPQQEAIVLRRYGLAYKPRFVVWQLWEGNDAGDAQRFGDWMAHPERTRTTLWERYGENSPILRLLQRTAPRADRSFGTLQLSDGTTTRLSPQGICDPDVPAEFPLGVAETEKAVGAAYTLCRSRGIHLVVVCLPHRERVLEPQILFDSPAAREQSFPGGIIDSERGYAHAIQRICDKLGCPYIDATPALREQAARDNRRLFLTRDLHLDVEGHGVVARLVMDWLRSRAEVL